MRAFLPILFLSFVFGSGSAFAYGSSVNHNVGKICCDSPKHDCTWPDGSPMAACPTISTAAAASARFNQQTTNRTTPISNTDKAF